MNPTVTISVGLAVLLGAYIGYTDAGIGGAILYGALTGGGAWLLGLLAMRTAFLVRRWWWVALAATAVIVAASITWGLYP